MFPALQAHNSHSKSLDSTHSSSPCSLQQPRNHDSFINGNGNFSLCLGPWGFLRVLASSSWGRVRAGDMPRSVHTHPWGHPRLDLPLLGTLGKMLFLSANHMLSQVSGLQGELFTQVNYLTY